MKQTGDGSIINTPSVMGLIGVASSNFWQRFFCIRFRVFLVCRFCEQSYLDSLKISLPTSIRLISEVPAPIS